MVVNQGGSKQGQGKIGLRAGGGGVVRAPFPDPPPLLGSRDGDPDGLTVTPNGPTREVGGGGS